VQRSGVVPGREPGAKIFAVCMISTEYRRRGDLAEPPGVIVRSESDEAIQGGVWSAPWNRRSAARGRPFIKGARLTVSAIYRCLSLGDSIEALVEECPEIRRNAFEPAFFYTAGTSESAQRRGMVRAIEACQIPMRASSNNERCIQPSLLRFIFFN
jgi:uncharacterized protein (DUF433 family)